MVNWTFIFFSLFFWLLLQCRENLYPQFFLLELAAGQTDVNQGIRKLASGKYIDLHPCRHITFHGIALHTSKILLTCMQGILFPIISHKIPWYPIKSRSDWWFFRMRYPPTPSLHCQVAKDRFGKEVFLLRSALNGQTVEPGTLVGFTVGKPGAWAEQTGSAGKVGD